MLFVGILGCALPSFASGNSLRLDFSGGGSQEDPNFSVVDAYPGMAGEGWQTEWKEVNRAKRAALKLQVRDQDPFSPNSGAYLQMAYEDLDGDVSATSGVQRSFSVAANDKGIDSTQPYKVRLQFRLESASEDFTTAADLIVFSGATALKGDKADAAAKEDDAKDAWMVTFRPTLGWMTRSGSGQSLQRISPKTVVLQPGVIWTVTVSLRPANSQYDVEIASSDGQQFEKRDIACNELLSSPPPAFLNFALSRKGTGKTAIWSIDNIEVLQN